MRSRKRLFGAHESVSGGLHTAIERIASLGGSALQIFTRNQRQWLAAPLTPEEIHAFRKAWKAWGGHPVASHASYLINLASTDQALREKSVQALAQELERCRLLGIPWLVLHPGSRGQARPQEALERAADSLDLALALADALERQAGASGGSPGDPVLILLENTAGQGSALGADVEELARITALSSRPERLGLCLDTCHAFAAGYDLRSRQGLDALLARLDLARLKLAHVNDSIGELGSRLDRHEHIGKGRIGLEGFRNVVTHPLLSPLPMVLETHKEKDLAEDAMNLKTLRELAGEE